MVAVPVTEASAPPPAARPPPKISPFSIPPVNVSDVLPFITAEFPSAALPPMTRPLITPLSTTTGLPSPAIAVAVFSFAVALTALPATSNPATASEPNIFIRWHFFSTARYLFTRFPTAPFDNVIPKLSFSMAHRRHTDFRGSQPNVNVVVECAPCRTGVALLRASG